MSVWPTRQQMVLQSTLIYKLRTPRWCIRLSSCPNHVWMSQYIKNFFFDLISNCLINFPVLYQRKKFKFFWRKYSTRFDNYLGNFMSMEYLECCTFWYISVMVGIRFGFMKSISVHHIGRLLPNCLNFHKRNWCALVYIFKFPPACRLLNWH